MIDLLAALFMLIDHTAFIFLDSQTHLYIFLRCIGRLALPLFTYRVALGYVATRSLNESFSRLFTATLISQIPYLWMIYGDRFTEELVSSRGILLVSQWNIGYTFIVALLIIYLSLHIVGNQFFTFVWLLLAFLVSDYGEYGFYGVLLVVIFYHYLKGNIHYAVACFLITNISFLSIFLVPREEMLLTAIYQFYSLTGLVIIYFLQNKPSKVPTFFLYFFYPLHIIALCTISYLMHAMML